MMAPISIDNTDTGLPLVFTDLEGSLHHSYTREGLQYFVQRGITRCATSMKTAYVSYDLK